MDKSRQQFEEWINKNHPKCSKYHKDIRLEAWQVSRDSLLLTLPEREKSTGNYDYFTDGYNSGISACETVLLDNGVKIKNE
ncbi:hypothetical protein [Proteus alimentorum]|uniref:hypothetical protein n=1 Tax=Proteus alimentorum TaxID=1973495 RepID=UPI000C000124|nr:hypothetical protein [Proteus alimentorum]